MRISDLDTPSLLIDRERMLRNIVEMQSYADANHVTLRPHTKTHKMPELARLQLEKGASGIAVAKVGEAEVMAENGLKDIFIANEIVGTAKLERIAALIKKGSDISFGVDDPYQVTEAERIFGSYDLTVPVLVEIEVGENRSGIIEEEDFVRLLECIRGCSHVRFKGLFSHDGNSYKAADMDELRAISRYAQERTLKFARLASELGLPCDTVSYGATPTFMNKVEILDGITELRPGTYILMDCGQGAAIGTLEKCAATVLATVMSRPTEERVILDVGAKGITMQERKVGITAVAGKGTILEYPGVHIDSVFDEHAIINNREFREKVRLGDKVRIIPVHICPVSNLYNSAYLVSGDEVISELEIGARGKLK